LAAALAVLAAVPPFAGVRVTLAASPHPPALNEPRDCPAATALSRRDDNGGSWDFRRGVDAAPSVWTSSSPFAAPEPLSGSTRLALLSGALAGDTSLLGLHCMLTA
jgi:hypothetical protein